LPEDKLILYVDSQFSSPYAMSVFVTLVEKNIPFEFKKINLGTKENYQPGYANRSLTCRVPTLAHGDFHLSESSAITEYLDEVFPTPEHVPVYPKDSFLRARARQVQAWLRSDFLPIREERSTEIVFCRPTDKPLSEAARASATILFTATNSLLKKNASNLFGEWCIADIDMALMINRLAMNGDEVPERLAAYARDQWQRASVQQWVNQPRSL
jgi:glutathione S-transferase